MRAVCASCLSEELQAYSPRETCARVLLASHKLPSCPLLTASLPLPFPAGGAGGVLARGNVRLCAAKLSRIARFVNALYTGRARGVLSTPVPAAGTGEVAPPACVHSTPWLLLCCLHCAANCVANACVHAVSVRAICPGRMVCCREHSWPLLRIAQNMPRPQKVPLFSAPGGG